MRGHMCKRLWKSHGWQLFFGASVVLAVGVFLTLMAPAVRGASRTAEVLARGGGTTMIEGGTGKPGFIPVLTTVAFAGSICAMPSMPAVNRWPVNGSNVIDVAEIPVSRRVVLKVLRLIVPTLPSSASPPVVYQTVPLASQGNPVATVSLPVRGCAVPGPKAPPVARVASGVSFQPA